MAITATPPRPQPPPARNRAFRFTHPLPDGWQEKTVFTLTGAVTDGIQHNITVVVDEAAANTSLRDYADWSIMALEEELNACQVLKEGEIRLPCGIAAYRVIYAWWPSEKLRLYQEMILVLAGGKGYRLAATFSKKTRKTLGPAVEQIMFGFRPEAAKAT